MAFQPHRFSRTQSLMTEFGRAFAGADAVFLTDIYAAGEDPIAGVTLDALADAVRAAIQRRAFTSCRRCSDVPAALARVREAGRSDRAAGRRLHRLDRAARCCDELTRRPSLMPVTAPADKRFRRAHLKPARKRGGLDGVALARRGRGGVVIAPRRLRRLSRGRRRIAGLPMFRVERIVVRGNHRLSNGEVLALLDGLRGRSVLAVDLDEWRSARAELAMGGRRARFAARCRPPST